MIAMISEYLPEVVMQPGERHAAAATARFAFPAAVSLLVSHVACAQSDRGELNIETIGAWRPELVLVGGFCLLGFVVMTMQFVLFLRSRTASQPMTLCEASRRHLY